MKHNIAILLLGIPFLVTRVYAADSTHYADPIAMRDSIVRIESTGNRYEDESEARHTRLKQVTNGHNIITPTYYQSALWSRESA